MGKLRKKIASAILGQDIDDLCLAWHQSGLDEGVQLGIEQAVHDITTDLLSDATIMLEMDIQMLQHVIDIVEN